MTDINFQNIILLFKGMVFIIFVINVLHWNKTVVIYLGKKTRKHTYSIFGILILYPEYFSWQYLLFVLWVFYSHSWSIFLTILMPTNIKIIELQDKNTYLITNTIIRKVINWGRFINVVVSCSFAFCFHVVLCYIRVLAYLTREFEAWCASRFNRWLQR